MGDFFFNLGRSVGASARKGKWLWQSLTGSEDDRIAAEQESGRDLAQAFAAEATILSEPAVAQVISDIGGKLAARVKNKLRKFAFTPVVMSEPNAFALPGGFIFITTGLLELCGVLRAAMRVDAGVHPPLPALGERAGVRGPDDTVRTFPLDSSRSDSPDNTASPENSAPVSGTLVLTFTATAQACEELAFILAHEMAHVIRGHAFDRMVNSTVVNAAAKAIPVAGMLGRLIVQAGLKFAHSAYSQEHEFEADELGTRLSAAAGYDPLAAVRLFERLGQGHAAPGGELGEYFSSHPPFKQRIAAIRKLMKGG